MHPRRTPFLPAPVSPPSRSLLTAGATLSATTWPLGDPGGAATEHWELTLTVAP
ncbi:hypothetical protein [Streptacidiphilus pinicola]|uniref:hypothetical protein n=1 Tax=Streptacidiphilus pinicola TaxID=2219663 RepID=UPI00140414DE|nr:hypothetical protein [Streptacidiphilus pinicola]